MRQLERESETRVTDRLNPLDVSFLYMESPTTAMHVGGVAVFQPPEQGLDYDRLVELISQRIALVPRYRQKVRWVPGRLTNPLWVDDSEFDVTYHVRRSALPKPGSDGQLRELVGRLMSRQLDRNRPLWEIYLVEGLSDGRVAVVTKTHHAMVDGVSAVDIGTVILDLTPTPREVPDGDWFTPAGAGRAEPGDARRHRPRQPPGAGGRHRPHRGRGRAGHRRQGALGRRWGARPGPHDGPAGAGLAPERGDR